MLIVLKNVNKSFDLFSVYTNLGDDAVIHALNETGVKIVVTSHELLPKFRFQLFD
jgi:long-chain acyl-CoA synthetase